MKLLFLTCADAAVVDTRTNQLSVFNILEQVSSASFPAVIPSFTVVALVSRKQGEPKKETLQIRLSFDRKKLIDFPTEVNFEEGLRHRSLGQVQGLLLQKPGTLKATVRHNNKTLGSWDIPVLDSGNPPNLEAK